MKTRVMFWNLIILGPFSSLRIIKTDRITMVIVWLWRRMQRSEFQVSCQIWCDIWNMSINCSSVSQLEGRTLTRIENRRTPFDENKDYVLKPNYPRPIFKPTDNQNRRQNNNGYCLTVKKKFICRNLNFKYRVKYGVIYWTFWKLQQCFSTGGPHPN